MVTVVKPTVINMIINKDIPKISTLMICWPVPCIFVAASLYEPVSCLMVSGIAILVFIVCLSISSDSSVMVSVAASRTTPFFVHSYVGKGRPTISAGMSIAAPFLTMMALLLMNFNSVTVGETKEDGGKICCEINYISVTYFNHKKHYKIYTYVHHLEYGR